MTGCQFPGIRQKAKWRPMTGVSISTNLSLSRTMPEGKAMKYALIALAILSIAGCASVRESYAPDGRKAYELNCSGTARSWDKCYSKAESLCKPAGYDVLSKAGEGRAPVGGGAGGVYGSLTYERSILIACKPA